MSSRDIRCTIAHLGDNFRAMVSRQEPRGSRMLLATLMYIAESGFWSWKEVQERGLIALPAHLADAALRRAFESGPIVSDKFLDAGVCELVLYLKTLPGRIQIQFLVRYGRQRLALGTDSSVPEVLIRHRKVFCGPFCQDLGRNGGEFHSQCE